MGDYSKENKISRAYSQDMEGGTLVKQDGSDEFTPTTGVNDAFTGPLLEDGEQGISKPALLRGKISYVKADAGVSAGDKLMPSGTNNGHVNTHAAGGETEVGFAITGASADGDGILAVIRTDDFG